MGNLQSFTMRIILFLLSILLASCARITTYDEGELPVFMSNEISTELINLEEPITAVSFNIEKSNKIDLAIEELANHNATKNIDILLLQEMDQSDVHQMAEALELNYLYFPISYSEKDDKNFGNAILTKNEIHREEKFILPHQKANGRIRNATNCVIEVEEKSILIYSIHTETVIMDQRKRMNQIDAIVDDIESKSEGVDYVLIGGDFNTILEMDLRRITARFKAIDMNWDSEDIGATGDYLFGIVKPSNDHFYSKNLKLMASGKLEDSKASDHLPIFVKYELKE